MTIPVSPVDKLWLPWSDLGIRQRQAAPLVLGTDVGLELAYMVGKAPDGQYKIVQVDDSGKLQTGSAVTLSELVDANSNPMGVVGNPLHTTIDLATNGVLAYPYNWVPALTVVTPATAFPVIGPVYFPHMTSLFVLDNMNVNSGSAHFFLDISPDNVNWLAAQDYGAYGNPVSFGFANGPGTDHNTFLPGPYIRLRWVVTAGWTSFRMTAGGYLSI